MNLYVNRRHCMTGSQKMTKKFIFIKVNVMVYIHPLMTTKLCYFYLVISEKVVKC